MRVTLPRHIIQLFADGFAGGSELMNRQDQITDRMQEYGDLVCQLINEIDELLGADDE